MNINDFRHQSNIQEFNREIVRLKRELEKQNVKVFDDWWPNLEEVYSRYNNPKSALLDVVDPTVKRNWLDYFDKMDETRSDNEYVKNMASFFSRQSQSNENILLNNLDRDYDPVSLTVKLIIDFFSIDIEQYNLNNCSKIWLEHNLRYYSGIGPSSIFYPALLIEAEKGYQVWRETRMTDDELSSYVRAVKYQQDLADFDLKRAPYEQTNDIALDKNNQGATTAPAYQNTRNEKAREMTKIFYDIVESDPENGDVDIASQFHRVQSVKNKLITDEVMGFDTSANKYWISKENLILQVRKLYESRGSFTYYAKDKPFVLEELTDLVKIEELPESMQRRQQLVDSGDLPASVLEISKVTGSFSYNYKCECPNIYDLVIDKYPEADVVSELGDKICCKHRGIKASSAYLSRLGQSFLYPKMDAFRQKYSVTDGNGKTSKYYGTATRLSHPDAFLQFYTDCALLSNPNMAKDVPFKTTFDRSKVVSSLLRDGYYEVLNKSDDKSGFDMFIMTRHLYCYATTYIGRMFNKFATDNDKAVFRRVIASLIVQALVSPDHQLTYYDTIVGSGHPFTNDFDSYVTTNEALTISDQTFRHRIEENVSDDTMEDDSEKFEELPESEEDMQL